ERPRSGAVQLRRGEEPADEPKGVEERREGQEVAQEAVRQKQEPADHDSAPFGMVEAHRLRPPGIGRRGSRDGTEDSARPPSGRAWRLQKGRSIKTPVCSFSST